jgi:hypothetical protein
LRPRRRDVAGDAPHRRVGHDEQPVGVHRARAFHPQDERRTGNVVDRRPLVHAAAAAGQFTGERAKILVRPEAGLLRKPQPRDAKGWHRVDPFDVDAQRVARGQALAQVLGVFSGTRRFRPHVQVAGDPFEAAPDAPGSHQTVDLIEGGIAGVPDRTGVVGAEGGEQVVRRPIGERGEMRGGMTGVTAPDSTSIEHGHGVSALLEKDRSRDTAHTRTDDRDIHLHIA